MTAGLVLTHFILIRVRVCTNANTPPPLHRPTVPEVTSYSHNDLIYSLNFPYLRVLALSICPNRTVSSVLNIYQFMCPMPTVLNMSEKS